MRTIVTPVLGLALAACGGVDQKAEQSTSKLGACGQTPAPALFEHALCICEDFDEVGLVHIGPGRDLPSIAVNGMSRSVTGSLVEGDWHAYGGLKAAAAMSIEGDLTSATDVSWVGQLEIAGNINVGGDLRGAGSLQVGGDVAVEGERATIGLERIGGIGAYASSGPPCGCDAGRFIDVPALVEIARTDNDNGARGVDARSIRNIGDTRVTLRTGRYYFDDVETIGRTRFVIAGAVSIYIDGHLAQIGDEQFEIEDGGSLDLYVSGWIGTVGLVRMGDRDDPSAFRLYIGGDKPLHLGVGAQRIYGTIYAPEARIAWIGDTHIDGAVFARHLDGVGHLDVSYTRPTQIDVDPNDCPGKPDDDDVPVPGGNGGNGGQPTPDGPDV